MKPEEYEKIKEIAVFEDKGWLIRATEEAIEAGMEELAKKLCEKRIKQIVPGGRSIDEILSDAKLADKVGLKEKARELREKCVRYYERSGQDFSYWCGAELADEIGMKEKAMELYKKAIESYEKSDTGTYDYAIEIARKVGMTEKAIELAEKKIEEALEGHEQVRFYFSAGEYAEKAGMLEKAIQLYIRSAKKTHGRSSASFEKAADIADKTGMTEKAKVYREIADVLKMEPYDFIRK